MIASDLKVLHPRFINYCRDFKSLSSNTLSAYEQDLTEFQKYYDLDHENTEFGGEIIGSYVRWLRDIRELKAATVRRRIACLKAFFRWAKENGSLLRSPFDDASIIVRIPKRLPRSLTRHQIRLVADAVSENSLKRSEKHVPEIEIARPYRLNPQEQKTTTYLSVCLMLATGIRVGELTSIRLADIDQACSVVNISGKGSRERTVFLTDKSLSQLLASYLDERQRSQIDHDILLLNARGNPLTPQTLRLRLRKLGDELSFIQRLTPHRFRHTAATVLLEEGIDIRYVQRLLGHSSISTTEIYTHVTDTSLRQALERADVVARIGV